MTERAQPSSAAPDESPESLYRRGNACLRAADPEGAATAFAAGLAQRPGEPALGINLALARLRLDQPAAAEAGLQAVAERGERLGAWHDCLGHCRARQARPEAAVAAFRAARAAGVESIDSLATLARCLAATGALEAAVATYREAVARLDARAPDDSANRAVLHNNLAQLLVRLARHDEAQASYRAALAAEPDSPEIHAGYLQAMHYDPAATATSLADAPRAWAARHVAQLTAQASPPPQAPAGKRPLTVGVLAGKLGRSPQLFLYLAAFQNLDPSVIHLVVYHYGTVADDFTRALAACTARWRQIEALSDAAAADRIRADGVDILLNKVNHAEGRMGIPARKPAPRQLQWGGVNTTGLATMDGFLTDWVENPAGTEEAFTEPLIRLPDGYTVFTPPPEAPPVGPLPVRRTGVVTFGCFNKPAKLNAALARGWAQLLAAVPNSRLYLRGDAFRDPAAAEALRGLLIDAGIPAARLLTAGPTDHASLLASYRDVDIALDSWPYSGGLTTLEALWMGVPVVTLPGPSFAGRHAASHLSNAGLADWIADDWESYRAIAARWADAPDALAALRAGLRARLRRSPVCDGPRFARNLTAALIQCHDRGPQR